MKPNNQQYVWYACYGSNLYRDRFMCYIQGGKPKNSTRIERGCSDTTPPIADTPYEIPRPLYFAKNAPHWNNGGAGLIGLEQITGNNTLSRKYLITREQFVDLVRQENSDFELTIDFEKAIEKKSLQVVDKRYGNLLFLGEEAAYPIFSFTIGEPMGTTTYVKPDPIYIKTIFNGLQEIYNFDTDFYVAYFLTKPGIVENYSAETLRDILTK